MTTQAVAVGENSSIPSGSTESDRKQLWIVVSLATVYLIWSTTYLAIRVALVSFPPYMLMGVRFLMAGAGLFAVLVVRGGALPTRKQWRNSAIVGGLLLVGGMGGVAQAEESISSGLAATLVAISPVWAMLFSMIWGGRPGRMEWIGVFLGILGVGLLSLEGNLQANPGGILLVTISGISWALGSVWSNHLDLPKGPMGNAAEFLAGGSLLMVVALLKGEHIVGTPTTSALLAMAYLTTFGSLATMTAYMFLLRTVKPALATSYALVNPALALLLGVAIGGETITGSAFIALPVILLGLYFVVRRRAVTAEH